MLLFRINSKYPILLPKNHKLTLLIIYNAHEKVGHDGVSETLTEIRSEFHIQKCRQLIRKLIYQCNTCRKYEGKNYNYPPPPDLPESRLKQNCSFYNIGIDYAGPVYVYNVYNKNNELFKAWISLITCQSSRAVYLDLATDYTGKSCINVLRRFFSRRGTPNIIISDNGSSFIAADVQTFATENRVRWKFNLQAAPWFGGFFERLVKSVKRCLNKCLSKSKVTYEEMLTLLIEIEKIINNRPLTYVYNDLSEEPLTPSHLVNGRRLGHNFSEDINDPIELNEQLSKILDHFWNRWSKDYLLELRENHRLKHNSKNTPNSNINVGDIVLVHDGKLPRSKWRVGRVKELINSKDNIIRGAVVTVSYKNLTGHLRRPINKLYPFECTTKIIEEKHEVNNIDNTNKIPTITFIDESKLHVFGRSVENVG